jgi:hypothetical protein
MTSIDDLFKGRHFDREIIILGVRWYLRFKLSLRDLVEMMAERGIDFAHTTIMGWIAPTEGCVSRVRARGQNASCTPGARRCCACSKIRKVERVLRFSRHRRTVVGMVTTLFALVSLLSFRVRGRASLELGLVALRH